MPKRALPPENQQTSGKRYKIGADPQEVGGLCRRCSKVVAASTDPRTLVNAEGGIQVAQVDEPVDQLGSSACQFCQLIASIKQPVLDGIECCLYAFSANNVYARVRKQVLQKSGLADSLVLGVLPATGTRPKGRPDDFIGLLDPARPSSQPSIGPQKIETRQADYEKLKTWIEFCENRHKGLCSSPAAKPPPKFRVIDIAAGRDVQAPKDCKYVALSYVWGNPAVSTNSGFSCVVQDSMVVCKALGYRYLWVDQHCNDQNDPDVLKEQVNAMDAVYGNAQLTIIAAAGEDSTYGLPGVNLRPRASQQLISLDKTTFIRASPHFPETLKASKWATRGWTFQEGILSKRKLIFTDHQAAFQCNGMHCSEAVYWPFQLMHAKTQKSFPERVPNPIIAPMTEKKRFNKYRPYLDLANLVEEYSARTLTNPSDRLRAILGILAHWATRKDPIYHVLGVLVSPNFTPLNTLDGWEIRLGGWFYQEPCARQPGFPSWSWAGWSGVFVRTVHQFVADRGVFQAWLEKGPSGPGGAEQISLPTFVNQHDEHREYSMASSFILLEVSAIDVTFTSVRWTASDAWKRAYYRHGDDPSQPRGNAFKDGIYAEFPYREYVELWYFYADDESLNFASLPGRPLKALLVESAPHGDKKFIVVVPRQGYHERVGYLHCGAHTGDTHADVTYRKADGTLTKTRPPPLLGDGDEEHPSWEQGLRTMHIRLG